MKLLPVGRVIVIGSVNADRILRCPVLPAPGETVLATAATQGFGGKGANQAVGGGGGRGGPPPPGRGGGGAAP
ncbi:hypothetical protein ACFV6I_36385, partial [Kitasatospora sp. NPDC059803]